VVFLFRVAAILGQPEEHFLDLIVDEELVHFSLGFESGEEAGIAQLKLRRAGFSDGVCLL